MHRDDYELVQTCGACPEQYDVFLDGQEVGYLRLRHGTFRAEYPTCGGTEVYRANPEGDGVFEYHERNHYLNQAIRAIVSRHHGGDSSEELMEQNPVGWTMREEA